MPSLRTFIAVVSLALVASYLMLSSERVSPGDISLVHASEPELRDVGNCSACHGGFLQSMTDACLACHEPMEIQIDDSTGFHGQLEQDLANQCASCHSEHHGPDFAVVSDRSFVLAGFSSRNEYDHRGLGYELEGVHLQLACGECHEHAEARVVPLGASRFLGLTQDCTTCHEDEHDGEYGTSCRDCHGQTRPFAEVGGVAHATFAPLTGSHAEVSCEECHAPETENAVHALALRHVAEDISVPERTCAACHESLHAEAFLAGVVDRAGAHADGVSCQHCHNPDHASFRGEDPRMEADLHAASGFPLELPHDEVECGKCHEGFGARPALEDPVARSKAFARSFPGRDADTCSSCHMDAHEGQFAESPFAEADCLGCHDRTAFAPTAFGLEHHERTEFPLAGSHADAECTACHEVPEGMPRVTDDGIVTTRFADTPGECSTCHEVPHTQPFLAGVSDLLFVLETENCDRCHDAAHRTFLGDQAPMDKELHVASGFALELPHGEVECAGCHEGFGEEPVEDTVDDDGFARFAAAFPGRDADTCQQCHTDPHVEQFAEAVFVDEECLACHDRTAFRPPTFGFDHHERTAFPLTGSHEAVSCYACHELPEGAPELTDAGLLTRDFHGTPTDCASCHDNVHGDVFDRPGLPTEVDGATGCARCHDTGAFEEPVEEVFDHGLWAGYEHEGAHRTADCDGCHVPDRSFDPPRLDYARVRGEDCSDCHQDHHVGQFVVDGRTECTRCHETAETFADLVFDHQVDSRFALDEWHVELDCDACHRPAPLSNGTEAIRYKPLGVECADCHDPEGLQTPARDDR